MVERLVEAHQIVVRFYVKPPYEVVMAKKNAAKTKVDPLLAQPTPFKRFHLVRTEDKIGVSGTGIVAVGCVFPDHSACIKWLWAVHSTVLYKSISDVEHIHGHEGSMKIVYIDE